MTTWMAQSLRWDSQWRGAEQVDAFETVTYICNMKSTSALEGCMSYEEVYGTKLDFAAKRDAEKVG